MAAPTTPEARLARALSQLAAGLLYPGSESDSPYRPFYAPLEAARPVDAAALRAALKLGPRWSVDRYDGDEWLERTIEHARDPNGADDPEAADAYELIRAVMHATLDTPLLACGVAYEGVAFHPTKRIIFGRLPSGALSGLLALSIET